MTPARTSPSAPSGTAVAPAKVLLHAINFHPEMIGCGKYSTELADYLSSRGHRVEVVTAPPHYPGWRVRAPYVGHAYRQESRQAARVYRCPILACRHGRGLWRLLAPLSFALFSSPFVIWRALASRPNVILCVEPTLFCAPAALLAAKLAGAQSVLHVQDLEVEAAFAVGHLKGWGLKRAAGAVERALLARFTRIITISGHMREALIAKGIAPERVEIIRNWVQRPHEDPPARSAYRQELGLRPGQKVVLYSGHIGLKQALDHVLEAAALLRARTDIVFVIAGEGPERNRLAQEAAELQQVRFLPLQPVERLHEFLSFADCHVLPQRQGTADLVLPSKLGGMLASGRPIVAMADPDTEIAEMLRGAAFLVPCGDAKAMAEAVTQAINGDHSSLTAKALEIAEGLRAETVMAAFEAAILDRAEPEIAAIIRPVVARKPPMPLRKKKA